MFSRRPTAHGSQAVLTPVSAALGDINGEMRRDDSRDIVDDAVDAVTLNQDVQWERCAQLATPPERRTLGTLRTLAPLFTAGDGADRASPPSATGVAVPFASRPAARVVHLLMAFAAVGVAAALLLLPWRWEDYHRAHGDLAVFMVFVLVGHASSTGLLLVAGRRDRRTLLLGGYFLFKAVVALPHMLPAFWGQMPPIGELEASFWEMPAPSRAFLFLYAFPLVAVAPVFLWAFARECPRVHRGTVLDDFARRMVPLSAGIGGVMWVAMASAYLAAPVSDVFDNADAFAVFDVAVATPNVLALAAVVVIALRAHTAPPDEVRRVVVFSAGFLIWTGVATAYDVVEAVSPGTWGANYQSGSVILLIQPLRFPGMVLLWYSVLAARVPHPREVVRTGCRRLLMRPGLLGGAAALPATALAWRLVGSPEQEVGAAVADPLARSLFVATGVMALLLVGRRTILRRLDAWIYPDIADQRHVLAAAASTMAKAEAMKSIARTVTRAVRRGCGSPAVLLATDARAGGHDFRAADADIAPLPRTSAIVHMLETSGGALRVHPSDAKSSFELLPREEATWVAETAADVIVPVPGPGAEVVGLLVAGRRFDDRIVRPVDVPFLEVLAAAGGQAVTRLRLLLDGEAAGRSEAPRAVECPVCRCVAETGGAPCCACGAPYVEADGPKLLASKFRLMRRLGAGGTGSVYLARDIELDRDVAVKTVAGVSGDRLSGLKSEARATARVTHPAVAQIHSVESWRGRLFLVVEFLHGGTLADRLRRGPVPAAEAADLTTALADGLAALHRYGFVHGDVKPSNIGFTADGAPKLLDFGLARAADDATVAGGTLRYLSPEVLDGRPADAADDVWSLCVVLYEMVTGKHPFAGGGVEAVADRIQHRRLRRSAPSAGGSEEPPVTAFAASVLTAPRSMRPATATAFIAALAMAGRR